MNTFRHLEVLHWDYSLSLVQVALGRSAPDMACSTPPVPNLLGRADQLLDQLPLFALVLGDVGARPSVAAFLALPQTLEAQVAACAKSPAVLRALDDCVTVQRALLAFNTFNSEEIHVLDGETSREAEEALESLEGALLEGAEIGPSRTTPWPSSTQEWANAEEQWEKGASVCAWSEGSPFFDMEWPEQGISPPLMAHAVAALVLHDVASRRARPAFWGERPWGMAWANPYSTHLTAPVWLLALHLAASTEHAALTLALANSIPGIPVAPSRPGSLAILLALRRACHEAVARSTLPHAQFGLACALAQGGACDGRHAEGRRGLEQALRDGCASSIHVLASLARRGIGSQGDDEKDLAVLKKVEQLARRGVPAAVEAAEVLHASGCPRLGLPRHEGLAHSFASASADSAVFASSTLLRSATAVNSELHRAAWAEERLAHCVEHGSVLAASVLVKLGARVPPALGRTLVKSAGTSPGALPHASPAYTLACFGSTTTEVLSQVEAEAGEKGDAFKACQRALHAMRSALLSIRDAVQLDTLLATGMAGPDSAREQSMRGLALLRLRLPFSGKAVAFQLATRLLASSRPIGAAGQEEGVAALRRAAAMGHKHASALLADTFLNARHGVNRNPEQAVQFAEQALPDALALEVLGTCLRYGWGRPQAPERARQLLAKAGARGRPGAAFLAAEMALRGQGGDVDLKGAQAMLDAASSAGWAPAHCRDLQADIARAVEEQERLLGLSNATWVALAVGAVAAAVAIARWRGHASK